MFNLVVLTGRLTADVELKYTQNNIPVCSFTIAVDRRYKQGEEKQTDFINITAWRGTAEIVSKYFSKGSMIGIEGSIQTRRYQDKDGNNRTAFEVIASNVQFVESKRSEGNGESNSSPTTKNDSLVELQTNLEGFELAHDDGDIPF